MNLRVRHERFKVFSGAVPDIERIEAIWDDCLTRFGGPWLMGAAPTVADAMYAPVATRFVTYGVALTKPGAAAYRDQVMGWNLLHDWTAAAEAEPDEMEELEVEF